MKNKLTYIDIFAGCGGISLGLYNSRKWHGLFAIEKSPDAFATLKFNLIDNKKHFSWPSWLPITNHDIYEVLDKYYLNLSKLKSHVDLVVGGPPCQGFSLAGRRLEKDYRNELINAYLRFVDIVKPRAILFENVKGFDIGFKQPDGKKGLSYSKFVIQELKKIGYLDASYKIINFSEYGVPQKRQRVIIFASLNTNSNLFFNKIATLKKSFLKSKKLNQEISLEEAISDLLKINGITKSEEFENFYFGKYANNIQSNYQNLMKQNINQILPDSHRFVNHHENIETKFQYIIKYHLKNEDIKKIYKTKKTTTRLLERHSPCPTLTTLPDDFIHYCEPRILTVREYARIQSFPDWYEIKGKYTTGGNRRKIEVPRYSQIGNAFPPLFSELCGQVIKELLSNGK